MVGDPVSASRRIIADGNTGVEFLRGRMDRIVADLQPGESLSDFAARSDEVVEKNVRAIADLIDRFDAFDVLELMRQRETPFTLTDYKESQDEGLAAAIDLIALTLVARGSREPIDKNTEVQKPNQIIDELHRRCSTILTVGTFSGLLEGEAGGHGPLTMLAVHYRNQELNVRFKQYAHLHDHFNRALFGIEAMGSLLFDALGFTYEDFERVREGIREIYLAGFAQSFEDLEEVARAWEAGGRSWQDDTQIDDGRSAFFDLFVFPGNRASFTAAEVSAATNIQSDRVVAVLRLFSLSFDATGDPVELVKAFLLGRNPFARAALLVDENENYITLGVPIGTDCFRQVVENVLKETPSWDPYNKRRAHMTEGMAVEYLQSLFGVSVTHKSLKYFRPKEGIPPSALDRSARDITSIADQTEADALFVVEDVAICVEVKGRSVSTSARQGHVQKLFVDLKETVGGATAQALRLETLIECNGGLWLGDRTWLDLDHVREIRSIAVCLNDMGPLGTALDELVRAGVIREKRFPWIVSLHDLAVVAKVLDRPAEFLLYLRRRTESDVSMLYHALDELDLFMLFLNGGLYVEPNPDTVFADHPTSGEPTASARKRHERYAVPTFVVTHTDPLDAWIYYQEGSSVTDVDKPAFASSDGILRIVDFLREDFKPGWFRFSADLLNLAADTQELLERGIKDAAEQTGRDSRPHSLLHCYAGAWGFPTLFVGTQPAGISLLDANRRLFTYMTAKKHQLRSDRALGLLINTRSDIVATSYLNSIPRNDATLDELGRAIGLAPIDRPTNASRTSVDERSQKRRRKAKKKRS